MHKAGRGSAGEQRHPDRVQDQLGAQVVVQCPAHDPPAAGVDHHGQVEEALPGAQVGDVGDPQLVRNRRGEVAFDEVVGGRGGASAAPVFLHLGGDTQQNYQPLPQREQCRGTPVNCVPRHRSGAGDRDRTGMASLEGWGSTIELHPRDWGENPSLPVRNPADHALRGSRSGSRVARGDPGARGGATAPIPTGRQDRRRPASEASPGRRTGVRAGRARHDLRVRGRRVLVELTVHQQQAPCGVPPVVNTRSGSVDTSASNRAEAASSSSLR